MVIVAQRTILGKSYSRSTATKGPRPRSRTLTAVQDAILEVREEHTREEVEVEGGKGGE